jgi:eukaryotic-like serine/threonine-protein kinase
MNSERWELVAELYRSALDRDESERRAFLSAACAGDQELRQEVESLLAQESKALNFLETPAFEMAPMVLAADELSSNRPAIESQSLIGGTVSHYRIIGELGSGGMGVVFEAEDTRLAREVALKFLPAGSSDPVALERFRREARAASALNHPNICTVYDVGEHNGQPFIAMELLKGKTLREHLSGRPLSLSEMLNVVRQLAEALGAAHRKGIIHRDIKPANIFITDEGLVKILDFGLAGELRSDEVGEHTASRSRAITRGQLTNPGTVMGTLGYMSPEQARGEKIDVRSDLFSLGAVFYEMATGRAPFSAKTTALIYDNILHLQPPKAATLNPTLPPELDRIISRCLEKDRQLRFQSVSELRSDLQTVAHDTDSAGTARRGAWIAHAPRWILGGAVSLGLLVAIGIVVLFRYSNPRVPQTGKWEQLTFLTDSAVYPAVSPDGRILAYIRGDDPFIGPGDVYVQLLPSGDPVQLTHDSSLKLSPVFSPDGSRITYSKVDPWDTWEVPVLGGGPQLFLANASSLTWIQNGQRLLFSEIKTGMHMALVTTDQGRGQSRDVYVPPGERGMVHHSYLSPDGRWVLVVVMGSNGQLLPCRVVPFDGRGPERVVGPPDAVCTSGAWSPDSKWIYLSSAEGGRFHIWRQKFPDGRPEQVTSGATEENDVAMAPDGKSLIASVGIEDTALWTHDLKGDHQLSFEGNAGDALFSRDGQKLYYLMQGGRTPGLELWETDLASGRKDRVLPGYTVDLAFDTRNYSVSADGKQVALAKKGADGISHLWVGTTDHRSSPREIPSTADEDSPFYLPGGDLVFRRREGGLNFLYRRKSDGSAPIKVTGDMINDLLSVSRDGRVVLAQTKGPGEEHPYSVVAYSLDGGQPVRLCNALCDGDWTADGRYFYLGDLPGGRFNTYMLPLRRGRDLPDFPQGGVDDAKALKNYPGLLVIPRGIDTAIGPSSYSYTVRKTQRNIFRIPLS